jgi:hypothetical protein
MEAVKENAASGLPRESWKPSEESLGVRIFHSVKQVEREFAGDSSHGEKEAFNRLCLLALESSLPEHPSDFARWSTLDRVPGRVCRAQCRPGRAKAREIRLETENDVDRFVKRVRLIPKFRFGCAIGGFENLIDAAESLDGAAHERRPNFHLGEGGVRISSASPSTRSIRRGGTEFPIIS